MLKLKKQFVNLNKLVFAYLFIFSSVSQLSYAKAPDFPPPPDASVEWVGQNIELNGIKSSIRAFHTKNSIEKVVSFYRKEWKRPIEKGKPGYMETIASAPWYIISRIEDGYLLTVQVQINEKDPSSSWGYLSRSPLPSNSKKAPELGKSIPTIPGSIVMTEMKSDDPGKKAKTVVISNTHSVRNNADFYRSHYQNKGWSMETDQNLGRDNGHSLVFKTRRDRVTIMLLKDKDFTRIVVNSVTNSIF